MNVHFLLSKFNPVLGRSPKTHMTPMFIPFLVVIGAPAYQTYEAIEPSTMDKLENLGSFFRSLMMKHGYGSFSLLSRANVF